jgi:hypothetical protein
MGEPSRRALRLTRNHEWLPVPFTAVRGPPYLPVHFWKSFRALSDALEDRFDSSQEPDAEPGASLLVPAKGFLDLGLSRGAEDHGL